jgi:imidazolonepropionase
LITLKHCILVRGARQLLTLHGPKEVRRGEALRSLGLIEDGSVLVINGVISNVGPTRRVENLSEARSAEEINAAGRVVMPGFVDSHTHLIGAPPRVVHGRQRATERLSVAATMQANMQYVRNTPASTLEHNAGRNLEQFLRHGTTTLEAKSGSGLNAAAESKMLRVLHAIRDRFATVVPTFFGAHTLPPEFSRTDEYLKWVSTEFLPKLRDRKQARFVDALCDPTGLSAREIRPYLDAARRLGFHVKVHADQSARSGGTLLAVEFGAVSADGLNHIEQDEVELLARSSTVATLLPGAVHAGFFDRFAPARQLIDGGAAVALASAFAPSAPSTFNMQAIVSLACSHMDLSPEEAISAATINGAHAVGQSTHCGSLQYGKDADLLVLNVSDYREIPQYFGSNIVALAMRKGHVVYREGALTCGGGS